MSEEQNKIKVVMLKGSITAKEINPLGEIPRPRGYETSPAQFSLRKKTWQDVEDKLRTFEIEFYGKDGQIITSLAHVASTSFWFDKDHPELKEGMTHEAILLPNNRIKLLTWVEAKFQT